MKNVLDFKWLVLPMMLTILVVGHINADVINSADSIVAQTDSVSAVANITDTNSATTDKTYSLLFGVLGSAIAAIVLLIMYYLILRPRFEVMPIVAYEKDGKKENKTQSYYIVLKNRSLFPVCNIQIELSLGRVRLNDDHESNVFSEQTCMYMAGRWRDENKRDLQIKFDMPKRFLPKELNISIIGKHALSGNSMPTEHIFRIDDFVEGHYEKGIFVKKGLDYTQALLRVQSKKNPIIVILVLLNIVLAGVLLFILSPWTIIEKFILLGLLILLETILFLLYQLHFINRVKAYSSTDPTHILKAAVVNMDTQRRPLDLANIEDVEGEEVKKPRK